MSKKHLLSQAKRSTDADHYKNLRIDTLVQDNLQQ